MQIIPKEIEGLDFFVVLPLNEVEDVSIIEKIKSALFQWCTNAIDGEYGGHMHFVHDYGYNEETHVVFAFIDMGSMNPEVGINALSSICENINKELNGDIIKQIELDGSVETLNLLSPNY